MPISHKKLFVISSPILGMALTVTTVLFVNSCSSAKNTSPIQDHATTVLNAKVWESKIVVGPKHTWPQTIINKCNAEYCRDFATPFGVYKLNDPKKLPKMREHFENTITGTAISDESYNYVLKQHAIFEADMLRAGCIDLIDASCSKNTDFFENYCGDKFNFGSIEWSACERNSLRGIPRILRIVHQCDINGRKHDQINLKKSKGSVSELIDYTFNMECVGWINSDHINKLPRMISK